MIPSRWPPFLAGREEYAHPILRWASWPLWRLAMAVFVVLLFLDRTTPGVTPWKVVGLALITVSIAADVANSFIVRRRRAQVRASGAAPPPGPHA